MDLLFTAPITRPALYGGGIITGVRLERVVLSPDQMTATAFGHVIEDGPGSREQSVTVAITGAETMTQLLAAIKNAIATALGVTFQ